MLHVVVICADKYSNQPDDIALKPLAEQLDSQLWGLLPGFHRLVFEGGQVLLTLCIGDVAKVLRLQQFEADFIDLTYTALAKEDVLYAAKAIARLCKPGTRLSASHTIEAFQVALRQCGFAMNACHHELKAVYSPAWVQKKTKPAFQPSTCVVIGAGLAGAAVASSLARRGWSVTVLDAAGQPASGASGLPVGLLVPHTSPDDGPLSRLSRTGVRMTFEQAERLLQTGGEFSRTGVLERNVNGEPKRLPTAWANEWAQAANAWSCPATPNQLQAAGVPAESTGLWHTRAGWIKPAALVKAWLAAPGVTLRANAVAAQVVPLRPDAVGNLMGWQVIDANGKQLAQAHLVVIASGYASQALAATGSAALVALQPIRGQVSLGLHPGYGSASSLPAFPVNGHGGFLSAIPSDKGAFWLMGSTYQRDELVPSVKHQDHNENFGRLQILLPQTAAALADGFDAHHAQAWAGVRCATPSRLPLLKQLANTQSNASLWVCAGMGSRGLTFAALCAELLAAQLHGEPLPIDRQLAGKLLGTKNVEYLRTNTNCSSINT